MGGRRAFPQEGRALSPLDSQGRAVQRPICGGMSLEVGPFQGPRVGSCLTLGNELVKENTSRQSKRIYWEGAPRQRAAGEPLCHTAHGLSLMVRGLVSTLSLANHLACSHIWSDLGSCLVACPSLSHQGFSMRVSGRLAGSSFLLVAPPQFSQLIFSSRRCCSMGPPIVRQFMQAVLVGGRMREGMGG